MKGLLRSKATLILVYLAMAAVAVYLNWPSGTPDYPTIIVTAVMFVIVFMIFCFAFGRFAKIDSMIRDLNEAAVQIRNDYRASGTYLWNKYSNRDVLFSNKTLARRYAEFRDEMDRLRALSGDIYHCDIEDYINQDLIDDTVSRNVLNLVSGTMTGLGILGTFIGLSLGLQQFNTGTSEEITASIGPLIQGIKVAFHTSIYGMVFSLFFSFIYKNKMDQAYEALDRFLEAYDNFVLPDSKNESFRQLLSFEQRQTEGMNRIAGTFAQEISTRVNEIMTPQFDRMNKTIENFARVAGEAQVEGVDRIVDKFIEQMNRSLSGTMTSLSSSIRETVEWQQQDRVYMRNILTEVGRLTNDTARAGDLANQSVESMASYVAKLDQFQGYLTEDVAGIQQLIRENEELSKQLVSYMDTLTEYEKQIIAASDKNLKNVIRLSDNMTDGLNTSAKSLSDAADTLNRQLNVSLGATVESYNRMQEELEAMIYAVDVLRRNTAALQKLKKDS